MPNLYFSGGFYIKQCSSCKRDFVAKVDTEDEAFEVFRRNFSPRRNARDGLESGCYRCRAVANMRIRFGIDVESMLAAQNNACVICGVVIEFNTGSNSVSACVDHDHKTDETRGILCRSCNLGLGHFKDNEELLKKAVKYLETWKVERKGTDTIKRDE
jgi:hypothetical protein